MVAWLSHNAARNARSKQELKKRLVSLQSGTSRKNWNPL
jgi:hypothetical protein